MCAWLGSRHKFLHVCGRGHSSGAPGRVKVDQCKVMGGAAAWGASRPEWPY